MWPDQLRCCAHCTQALPTRWWVNCTAVVMQWGQPGCGPKKLYTRSITLSSACTLFLPTLLVLSLARVAEVFASTPSRRVPAGALAEGPPAPPALPDMLSTSDGLQAPLSYSFFLLEVMTQVPANNNKPVGKEVTVFDFFFILPTWHISIYRLRDS